MENEVQATLNPVSEGQFGRARQALDVTGRECALPGIHTGMTGPAGSIHASDMLLDWSPLKRATS